MKINRLLADVITTVIASRIRSSGGTPYGIAEDAVRTARSVKDELDAHTGLLESEPQHYARDAERLIAINDGLRAAVAKTCTLTDALRQEITAKAADIERLQLWLSRATDAQKGENEARVAAEKSAQQMAQRLAYVLAECGGSCAMAPESIAKVDDVPWEISTEADQIRYTDDRPPVPLLRYRITFRPEVQTPAVPAILPDDERAPF